MTFLIINVTSLLSVVYLFFWLVIGQLRSRRLVRSSAASDVYKRQTQVWPDVLGVSTMGFVGHSIGHGMLHSTAEPVCCRQVIQTQVVWWWCDTYALEDGSNASFIGSDLW